MSEADERRIAIVDDDQAVLESLRFLLEVVGHVVETFGSAVEFLSAEPRNFAGLILDQHMPTMTGLELVERLRSNKVAIPILLITGSLSPGISARASELGIERVLEKPPMEEVLLGFVSGL